MNKLSLRFCIILSAFVVFFACKKETSLEKGGFGGTAQGELVDSLGNCKAATIVGTYSVDTPLNNTTNYVNINVNFTAQGKYKIYSDTANGMWFLDSGFAVSTGTVVIKLKGYGTPILPKTTDFALMFNNNVCSFAVPVSGSGTSSGGGSGGGSGGTNGDYFPTTTGSSWVYQYIPKLGTIDTFSVKVAAGQVTVDSLSYSQFATRLQDTFYFAKDAARGIYYAYSSVDFDYTFLFDSIPNKFITYPFLKENANVGETWSTTDYGTVKLTSGSTSQYGDAKAVFTIIAKGSTHAVAGQTYTNVINVKRDILFRPTNGTYTTVLSGNSYYAKGFGLIDQVFTTSPSQAVSLFATPVIK
jgi:hypothetical protein